MANFSARFPVEAILTKLMYVFVIWILSSRPHSEILYFCAIWVEWHWYNRAGDLIQLIDTRLQYFSHARRVVWMTHYVNVKFSDTIAEFLSHLLRTAFNARMKWIHWNNHWLKFINSIQIKFSVSLRILWIFNVVFSKFLHPHSDKNSIQFKRTEVVSPFFVSSSWCGSAEFFSEEKFLDKMERRD